jgi:hypothetical protein
MTVEGTTRGALGRRVVIESVMLGMFLTAIEISIVATAAPAIVSQLGGLAEFNPSAARDSRCGPSASPVRSS